jgi:hypothetical protein
LFTENLSTLTIHKLTKAQYDRELAAGRIDENALYLTPDEGVDLSGYATESYVNDQIAAIPTPDVSGQITTALSQAKESGEFNGSDGYTPVRGTDYWTDADKAEIKSYVDEAILGGAW